MKVALAITGFPRFFSENYKCVRKFILDKYDAVTFAAIYEPVSDREYDHITWRYSKRSYPRTDFLAEFSECYKPMGGIDCRVFVDELPRLILESKDIPHSTGRAYAHRGIYSQVETWAKSSRLIAESGINFDVVIRWRTDLFLHDFNPDLEYISHSDKLFVAGNNAMGWEVGAHGECGRGINEQMWICTPRVHAKFSEGLFNNLKQYSIESGSCYAEQLADIHTKRSGIEVSTFPCSVSLRNVGNDNDPSYHLED